ncbi:zinc transporter ZntB [Paracoccaceae bacterium GXU_MW_L88]
MAEGEAAPPGCLYSLALGGPDHGNHLDRAALEARLRDDALAWVHLDANAEGVEPWLKDHIDYLEDFVIEALMAESTRPRIVEVGKGLMAILKGVNDSDPEEPEDMIAVRLYVDPHRIISVERRKSAALHKIAQEIEAGQGPQEAAQFLSDMIINLNEDLEAPLLSLREEADRLEDQVLENPSQFDRDDVVNVRSQAVQFRRHLTPQRDAVTRLSGTGLAWFSKKQKRRITEEADELTRFVEDLDGVRDRMMVVKDEHESAMTEKLNRNLYVLSIISAVFLPLGFLTGLFGINIGGMPGVNDDNAFWLFSGSLVILMVAIFAIFRRLKWF